MQEDTPLLLQPQQLADRLGETGLCVIDVSDAERHAERHIPGALQLDYAALIAARPPAMGLLPEPADFHALLQRLGIRADTWVVACDDEGGGRGARLIWSLHAYGHRRCALLDGGMTAWLAEGYPLSHEPSAAPPPSDYAPAPDGANVCDADYILGRLGEADFALLDARSAAEFSGEKAFAQRGGHIPGARRYEWTDAIDTVRNGRLRPAGELRAELAARGLSADREIVAYCQTHHRSALSWVMLKALGYPRVRGYHGAWSDWGNRQDTPVESGADPADRADEVTGGEA